MEKYKRIQQRIILLENELDKLREELQEVCPHKKTKDDYYIGGDTCWPNTGYRVEYTQCLDCGLRWDRR